MPFFSSVALQSLKAFGRLTYRRFLQLFRHMVGLLGRVISPSQGLYLHRTTQHRKTRTNIHTLSGIRTHDLSNQPAKTYASDRTATVTGRICLCTEKSRESRSVIEGYRKWIKFCHLILVETSMYDGQRNNKLTPCSRVL
jgi:hypothetical protein